MIDSSDALVSTSTSNFERSSSTPASAIVSRTRTLGGNGALVRLEGLRDGDAALDVGAHFRQRELDRGERRRDVEHVEPADVADPEDLPLELALAWRDRDAVAVAKIGRAHV